MNADTPNDGGSVNKKERDARNPNTKRTWLTWSHERIKEAGGTDTVLAISPEMVHFCDGNHKFAAFFTHLLFWQSHSKTGWVYKTWKDWFQETALTQNDASVAARHFVDRKLIKTELRKAKNGSPTLHYQVQTQEFEKSFSHFLEFRKSGKWISQKVRIRFSKNWEKRIVKSAKTSNRDNNRNNARKNIQTTPKPPQGARGLARAKHPPLSDPMCQSIADACNLDIRVNERKIRALVHRLRLAGYDSAHMEHIADCIDKAMPMDYYGPRTLRMVENHILATWDYVDEDEFRENPTVCIISGGKVYSSRWRCQANEITAKCCHCGTPIVTFAYSPPPDKSGSWNRLYCSQDCLMTDEPHKGTKPS